MPSDLEGCDPSSDCRLPDCKFIVGHNVDFDWKALGSPEVKIRNDRRRGGVQPGVTEMPNSILTTENLFGVNLSGTDSHHLAYLPEDRARELEKRIRYMAIAMWRKYRIDAQDLFSEGIASVVKLFKVGDTIGHMILFARWGMKSFVSKEMHQRITCRKAAMERQLFSRTSRSFENLEFSLASLTESDRTVMQLWLDGVSLNEIMRRTGKWKTSSVKLIVERCVLAMATVNGVESVRLDCLWPNIVSQFPKGIFLNHGRYGLKVFKKGKKVYIGTYGTIEEAVNARDCWYATHMNTECL